MNTLQRLTCHAKVVRFITTWLSRPAPESEKSRKATDILNGSRWVTFSTFSLHFPRVLQRSLRVKTLAFSHPTKAIFGYTPRARQQTRSTLCSPAKKTWYSDLEKRSISNEFGANCRESERRTADIVSQRRRYGERARRNGALFEEFRQCEICRSPRSERQVTRAPGFQMYPRDRLASQDSRRFRPPDTSPSTRFGHLAALPYAVTAFRVQTEVFREFRTATAPGPFCSCGRDRWQRRAITSGSWPLEWAQNRPPRVHLRRKTVPLDARTGRGPYLVPDARLFGRFSLEFSWAQTNKVAHVEYLISTREARN